MNRKKRFISIAIAIALTSGSAIGLAEQGDNIPEYPGETGYREKYENANFKDMKNHWASDAVYTMGSLGMIKGTGGGTYMPQRSLTKEEALLLIVRLMGLEDEAQAEGLKLAKPLDTAGYKILNPYHYNVMGAISVAESAGILDDKELANINPVTESTQQKIDSEVAKELGSYSNKGLTASQLKNIESELAEKVKRKYTWGQPASREVAAYWLGRAISPEGVTGNSQQAVATFKDWEAIREKYIPYIEAVVQNGYMNGNDRNEFAPKGTLTRAEMGQILYNARKEKLKEQGYKLETGKVIKIEHENTTQDGKSISKRTVQIRNSDNKTVEFYTQSASDGDAKYERGLLTYIGKRLSNQENIRVGQMLDFYISPSGEAALATDSTAQEKRLEGKLLGKYEDMLLLEGSNGQKYRYPLAEGAVLSVNGKSEEMSDLVAGMQGVFHMMDSKIYKLEITVPEGGLGGGGNIAVGDYFDTGIVVSKSEAGKKLVLAKDGGSTETYDLSAVPNVPVYKDGAVVSFSSIRDGDSATIYFSDTSKSIAKIVLSPHKTRTVKCIYKGRIFYYNRNKDEIRLGDSSLLDGTSKWEELSEERTLPINDRADIYATDESGTTDILISRNTFEDYATYKEQQRTYIENALKENKDVYLYTEVVNGREEITRIVLKEVGEYRYSGVVSKVSNGVVSIPSNQNIYYNNSTIVLKEGRLVSPATIKSGDTVTVYTHQGRNTAAVIVVEGVDVSEYPFTVYSTRIVDVNLIGQSIEVSGTASQKVQGSTVSSPPVETLNLPTDAVIQLVPGKTKLSQDEFFTRYYKQGEKPKAKIVTNSTGDILSMQVYSEDYNRPNLGDIRTGKVSGKNLNNETVTLTDVRTWTGNGWSTGVKSMTFDFSNAIVLVNGVPSRLDRVKDGASVDVITDVNTGHTIIVR